jgi:hypothetical protein
VKGSDVLAKKPGGEAGGLVESVSIIRGKIFSSSPANACWGVGVFALGFFFLRTGFQVGI